MVGGTKGDNTSVNTVEMLPLDAPINSGCRSVASLPQNLDRAIGANFFPFWGVNQRVSNWLSFKLQAYPSVKASH